jgi:PAS domain S-box-containing protein
LSLCPLDKSRTFGYTRDDALGRTLAELIVPPSLRDLHSKALARFVETREGRLFGRRLELTGMRADGSEFPVEVALSCVETDPLLVCGALRDLTAVKRAEDDLRTLADEQAALRRVATLAAAGIEPDELFSAVSEEVARLLGVDGAGVGRFEPDRSEVVVVGRSESLSSFPIGSRQKLGASFISGEVYRTGRAARVDLRPDHIVDAGSYGDLAQRVLAMGFLSTVAAPIVVEGELWGVVTASSSHTTLRPDTEKRIESFCELVGTAIANAESRAELAASEARARALATEQAALRRVATLVAQGTGPDELFSAVATEVAGIIDIPVVGVSRYEADGTLTVLGVAGETSLTVGSRWPGIAGMILAGRLGEVAREDQMVSTLGVPIVVEGSVWGFMIAAAEPGRPIPADTEERLARFTELVATAVSNATTRSELVASRARIVTAADEARRRIERNLHDGTQQRLVALGLDVECARAFPRISTKRSPASSKSCATSKPC